MDPDAKPTRAMWLTLVAMTLANSMILVDQTAVPLATTDVIRDFDVGSNLGQWVMTANILPLAALMVLGGKLGDLLGTRRVFLFGGVVFGCATALAGFSQDMPWMIAARVAQGTGAALMMPNAVAITSAVWPHKRRGYALGVLAGGSAFFAALGPVLGGLLTSIDWRLVFLINVPLALATILITLSATPPLAPSKERQSIDYAGAATFGLAIAGLVFGLAQGQPEGWTSAQTVIPLIVSAVSLVAFVVIEHRVSEPMIEFRLFRNVNFLAANISQVLAGSIELGLGYLIPFFLLLVIGVGPAVAGIVLLPGTIPIILAGPLAGRMFDRVGGRMPLVIGFLCLAASGVALAFGTGAESAAALIPGLVLQGLGLGIVLTVNDPTGLNSVPEEDAGQAAGVINTTEQMGGAIGIAALSAVELSFVLNGMSDKLAAQHITATTKDTDKVHDFIERAFQHGLHNLHQGPIVRKVIDDVLAVHVTAFQVVFGVTAGIGLVGAVLMFLLVRKDSRVRDRPIFSRRSRWVIANQGRSAALTRHRAPPN